VLPGLALASIPLAIIVRITRASVLEVLGEDFVRTAEAKGLTENVVRRRHVLRNAMLPVATSIGLLAGGLLSGAVLTETVFAFSGIGAFVADSISQRDYPVLMGFILIIAVVYVLVNLIVDLSYSLIDPRVRVR
jgi:peptide/nickel transport system permease protein